MHVEITCLQPETDETVEANSTNESLSVGEALHFDCIDDAFEFIGERIITCEDNGFWSTEQLPFCRGEFFYGEIRM